MTKISIDFINKSHYILSYRKIKTFQLEQICE